MTDELQGAPDEAREPEGMQNTEGLSPPDEGAAPAQTEEQAKGSFVDAEVGHQADKPAVEGDPDDEPQPYDGPPPAADFE